MGIGFEHDMDSVWLEMDLIERGVFLDEGLFPAECDVGELLESEFGTVGSEMAY